MTVFQRRPPHLSRHLDLDLHVKKTKKNISQVSKDKLTVSYTGSGSHTNDVGAIQADAPAPRACAIAYFEVEVVSVGERGLIGVGLTDASAKLGRQPGWEPGTFGYHGDDGRKYHARGSGEPYGPRFGNGDVVGCGIDWEAREVFFTKNGKYLGAAFRSASPSSSAGGGSASKASAAAMVASSAAATSAAGALTPTTVTTSSLTSGSLYPTIGLHSRGEKVTANFGAAPFRFDLEGAVDAARARAKAAVEAEAAAAMAPFSASSSSSFSSGDVSGLCLALVRDYLLTQGFERTLGALDKSAGAADGGGGGRASAPPSSDDGPTRLVAEITLPSRAAARRALVSEGDVEAARGASGRVSAGGRGEMAATAFEAIMAAAVAAAHPFVAAAALAEPEVALLLDAQELIESLRKGGTKEGSGDDEACEEVEAALGRAQRSAAFARALSPPPPAPASLGGGGGGDGKRPPPPPPPSHSEFACDVLALAAYPRPQDSPFAGLASRQQRQAAADALNAALLCHWRAVAERGGGGAGGEAPSSSSPAAAAPSPPPPSSSSSWPTSKLDRALRQLVAAAAEAHFAGGGAGEPFRLEELVPSGAAEAAAAAAAPLPP